MAFLGDVERKVRAHNRKADKADIRCRHSPVLYKKSSDWPQGRAGLARANLTTIAKPTEVAAAQFLNKSQRLYGR
ncbi:hypothetical protein GCM10010862_48220 [Devosia nitrariae]|uniref:Uncharacterized protein n=1 Tax=Devosia nitrariae TaxID=2071872 RepID=A0ABQ5WCX9_9HYPH|nr:hypothetical protein GCM10010862_48220 [Devosia nitrariae]